MKGIIDISKLKHPPERHELDTARFFADRGYNIEFIPPSNIPEVHRPDIVMDGKEWEIKCPTGKGKHTIIRNLREGTRQSRNIIMDLRRIAIPESKSIHDIEIVFDTNRSIRKIFIICKDENLLKLQRKSN